MNLDSYDGDGGPVDNASAYTLGNVSRPARVYEVRVPASVTRSKYPVSTALEAATGRFSVKYPDERQEDFRKEVSFDRETQYYVVIFKSKAKE